MRASSDLGRPRRLYSASRERFESWFKEADAFERYQVSSALLAVADGSWVDNYLIIEDFERGLRYHIMVSRQTVLTIRLYAEYPGEFSISRIGPIQPA